MKLNQLIELKRVTTKKDKPDLSSLGFGKHFTDHMFVMEYDKEKGWHDPRITPYEPLVLDPAAAVFHYGQAIFEGLKAYRTSDNRVLLFRPSKNIHRLNVSSERMSMPPLDEELVLEAVQQLIDLERDWIPTKEGTSLYIRPFVIATESCLGVKPALQYKFMIILSPVGAYYANQLQPVRIFVEEDYVRAVRGGVGAVKTGGNYAASLQAQLKAEKLGYDQVLWLDGVEKKYVEEVGSMNIFFKIKGEVFTPALNGSILGGITRDSVIEMLRSWNVPVHERRITIQEVYEAYQRGEIEEVFGTGTAAVISPVGELSWNDERMIINNFETGELSMKIYQEMTDIQLGRIPDPYQWTVEV